jgi:phospholipid/cholesterol/gamma-HCH transport system substrate-binding protein
MTKETRVGTLVLAALVIAAVAIFLLGRQEHVWERKVSYTLHFARTNGLQKGAPVSLSGLPIGSVDRLHFATDPGATHIVVEVDVDANVAPRIRTDTKATIRTLGLLGDKYIELVPGTEPTADAIPAGGIIPSVDPTDYEAIMGQSGDILENVLETTSALKDVLQTIQRGEGLLGAMVQNKEFGARTMDDMQHTLGSLRETSESLDRVLHGVEQGNGVLGKMLGDQKLATSLERSVQNLERVTTRFDRGEGAAMRLVSDREYGEKLLGKLDKASSDLADVAAKLNEGQGTLGKLINDSKLYDETRGLVHDVRTSWLVRLYQGARGLWPVPPSEPPATPAPKP